MPAATYSPELAELFCSAVAEGDRSISEICQLDGMPSKATIFRWKADNEEFRQMYEAAKDMQLEVHVDECARIADKCSADRDSVAKARLQIYARLERAQLLRPKAYSKRVTQEHTGEGGGPLVVEIVQFGQSPDPE